MDNGAFIYHLVNGADDANGCGGTHMKGKGWGFWVNIHFYFSSDSGA